MTEYQLLYMGFLRARHDFPLLNHTGHEPHPTVDNLRIGKLLHWKMIAWVREDKTLSTVAAAQRAEVERDFGRPA